MLDLFIRPLLFVALSYSTRIVISFHSFRYLWPLIHYHKFLAKSIRKLRRNGIDVKTSTSSVSLFLRQEVCNVSDHLAFISKYDSEEWTNALRGFVGWTGHTLDVEESVRKLVLQQKLQGINEMSDLDSSLLRSQVSDAMLRAIKAEKEKLAQDAYSQKEAPVANRQPKNDAKNGNVSYVHVGVLWFRFPTRVSCSHLAYVLLLSSLSGNDLLYTARLRTRK